ncbi:MAG: nickel pincer cofactor biosynthesis protein LarC [Deltaproteobacteria bacterium]|nr:nickel pincer cofactor biosynthesis protein LarC [Deltaproteobacteria bacterium]
MRNNKDIRILYFDCVGGIAGDMVLGALADAGGDLSVLKGLPAKLGFNDLVIEYSTERPHGFRAGRVKVSFDPKLHPSHRTLADIENILDNAGLKPNVEETALDVFRNLVRAEADAHGVDLHEAHLHEAGAVDAIADIVGSCMLLDSMRINEVACSPLPMGAGFVQSAHGKLPLPAPAVAILLEGVPVTPAGIEGETVTPTGAALVKTLCKDNFGPMPAMTVECVGVGAGSRDQPGLPNITRAFVGTKTGREPVRPKDNRVIECTVDDMDSRLFPQVMEKLMSVGALDCHVIPVLMKKGRPGHLISVLAKPGIEDALLDILFTHTTTLGCRIHNVEKRALDRRMSSITFMGEKVRVKEAIYKGKVIRISPEYDDCLKIAEKHGLPLIQVMEAVSRLASK